MKIKQGQAVPMPTCDKKGCWVIASRTLDLLILDCFKDCKYEGRYLMNVETGEYGILRGEEYSAEKLMRAFENDWWGYLDHGTIKCAEEDGKIIRETIKHKIRYALDREIGYLIDEIESQYMSDKRWDKEQRRQERLRNLMNTVPALPPDFEQWALRSIWKEAYPIYKNDVGQYVCPCCGRMMEEEKLRPSGKNVRHNGIITCDCGQDLQVKRRGLRTEKRDQVMIFQETSEGQAVYRHIDVKYTADKWGHGIDWSEAFRIFIAKKKLFGHKTIQIYYNQHGRDVEYEDFDRRNPSSRRDGPCYLYPQGIESMLKNTEFACVSRLLAQMAATGMRADYNHIMVAKDHPKMLLLAEYLFKGRFYRLLEEEIPHMGSKMYWGALNIEGETIEEIMRIGDRQKINRLRNRNGGNDEREWLAYGDETDEKISEAFLNFIRDENLGIVYAEFILDRMSPEQIMNYVRRQQDTSYKGKTAKEILSQWKDYMMMCTRLGKDITDELTYRPRELKRRHDEAVEAMRKLDMIEEMSRNLEAKERRAKELRKKYPGAEEILAEIAPRYEYENEEYKIIVPKRLTDIMSEGNALHHCVGSTDRYFERIRDQETYICFLRRKEEPELPYYTIEVEPGGTIRQHRGMYDEEPNIEEIRGFLREWQKVLKKRLHSKDWQLAEESRIKREKNLEELRQANNARVLKGLAEDFMEAV